MKNTCYLWPQHSTPVLILYNFHSTPVRDGLGAGLWKGELYPCIRWTFAILSPKYAKINLQSAAAGNDLFWQSKKEQYMQETITIAKEDTQETMVFAREEETNICRWLWFLQGGKQIDNLIVKNNFRQFFREKKIYFRQLEKKLSPNEILPTPRPSSSSVPTRTFGSITISEYNPMSSTSSVEPGRQAKHWGFPVCQATPKSIRGHSAHAKA